MMQGKGSYCYDDIMDIINDSDMSLRNYAQINMEALLMETQYLQTQRPNETWLKSNCNYGRNIKAPRNSMLDLSWSEYKGLEDMNQVLDDMEEHGMNDMGLVVGLGVELGLDQRPQRQQAEIGRSIQRSHKSFDLPLLKQRSCSHLWNMTSTPTPMLSSRNNSCRSYSHPTQEYSADSMVGKQQHQEHPMFDNVFSRSASEDEGSRSWQSEQPKAKRACLRNRTHN
mmetsp:Transcript_11104/g.19006  ORF Transcript_11104/g.19006 Transcript_11104/m.19006 type:complete len:226 (-) Transcript_11104:127-804(-)|eukprot:CAMPEP_0184693700 /NCGR_PEP_ID=MMETSP0313-20130426/1862_1 /TAXON_ID=2792 /ORGANISM="Porphyridium aerugineum, Strain SAG 1380-2" /LENGTH=225 /DNA_ID=CAMNT_0027151841 /DNA_START=82 /DNA_END=759 /DNA_ORIENTATION=+